MMKLIRWVESKLPIYFYWPNKPIPEWFQKLEFTDETSNASMVFKHDGHGFVLRIRGYFVVCCVSGYAVRIENLYDAVMTGGGKGVIFALNFKNFCEDIYSIIATNRPSKDTSLITI